MNLAVVRLTLGRILQLAGALMFLPMLVSLLYRESGQITRAYLLGALVTFGIGSLLSLRRPQNMHYYAKEGFVITSLSWILLSAFGSIPLLLSGEFHSVIDAFFEMAAGFTTTGATVAGNIERLSRATLFWRSFAQFLGGMGVLVFALALQPHLQAETFHVMRAEMPGPQFAKISARLSTTARILYLIYMAMTVILFVVLLNLDLSIFDSLIFAMETAGTGGFGIRSASVAYYNSPALEYTLGVAMILFGVNFNVYYFLLIGQVRSFFKSEELRWYLFIIACSVGLIFWNTAGLYSELGLSAGQRFRDSFFTVSSLITTTGYVTFDYDQWPLFSKGILFIIMFIGGSAGSTAGGIKVSRIVIMAKTGFAELLRTREPRRVIPVHFEGRQIDSKVQRSVLSYLAIYAIFFLVALQIIMLDQHDLETAFSAVLTAFNNHGIGMGGVGPSGSFAIMNPLSKITLSIAMIAGRLEIWPLLILFSRETWRRA